MQTTVQIPLPVRVQNIVIRVCVCLSIREHISKTKRSNFDKLSVRVGCRRGSGLLWRRCDTLCTRISSFWFRGWRHVCTRRVLKLAHHDQHRGQSL